MLAGQGSCCSHNKRQIAFISEVLVGKDVIFSKLQKDSYLNLVYCILG